MKVGTHAQLSVKWANGSFTYYRVSPHRQREKLIAYYRKLEHFRFAILFEWHKETKTRGNQILYFDKKKES